MQILRSLLQSILPVVVKLIVYFSYTFVQLCLFIFTFNSSLFIFILFCSIEYLRTLSSIVQRFFLCCFSFNFDIQVFFNYCLRYFKIVIQRFLEKNKNIICWSRFSNAQQIFLDNVSYENSYRGKSIDL